MKVFLLTVGEYSDYHVAAAYSTLAFAESALKSGAFDEESRIEDFDIDPPTTTFDELERGWRFWSVNMDADGNVKPVPSGCGIPHLDSSGCEENSKNSSYADLMEREPRWRVVHYNNVPATCYEAIYNNLRSGDWRVRVFANSKDMAIKTASEKRAFAMANPFLGVESLAGNYNLPDTTTWEEAKNL